MKKLIGLVGLLSPLTIHAQSLGVFCWKLNPFSDILCFDVESKGFVFELTGTQEFPTNDVPSHSAEVPSHGAANLERSSNNFHLGFTSYFSDGRVLQFFVSLDTTSLNGTWTSSLANSIVISGDFAFQGTGPLNTETIERNVTDKDSLSYLSYITSLQITPQK